MCFETYDDLYRREPRVLAARFLPCRHACVCGSCATMLLTLPADQQLCTVCRRTIVDVEHGDFGCTFMAGQRPF